MSYKIEVRPLAVLEILEAYDFYSQIEEDLGMDFLAELEAFYDNLFRNPKTYSYYEMPVRQGSLKRFPYTVIYEVIESVIIIYSVFMARQDPSKKITFKK